MGNPSCKTKTPKTPKRKGQVPRSCTYFFLSTLPLNPTAISCKNKSVLHLFPGCFDHKISSIWYQLFGFWCFPYSTWFWDPWRSPKLNLQKKNIRSSHELMALGCFFWLSFGIQLQPPPKKKEVLNVLRGSGQQPAKVTSQCSQVAVKVILKKWCTNGEMCEIIHYYIIHDSIMSYVISYLQNKYIYIYTVRPEICNCIFPCGLLDWHAGHIYLFVRLQQPWYTQEKVTMTCCRQVKPIVLCRIPRAANLLGFCSPFFYRFFGA